MVEMENIVLKFVQEKFYQGMVEYLRAEKRERSEIHVSDLLFDCLRSCYYYKTDNNPYLPGVTMDSIIRMVIGKKVHEIPIPGSVAEKKVEWNGIVGHIDNLFLNEGILMDKKTTRKIPNYPYDHHIKQLEYYMLLAKKNGYSVNFLVMLYIDVDSADVRAFIVNPRREEEIEKEMRRKADVLKKALSEKKIPDRMVSWKCTRYCGYCVRCFME